MSISFRALVLAVALFSPLLSVAQVNTTVNDVSFKLKFNGRTNLDFGSFLGADDGKANRNGVAVNDSRLGVIADIDTVWQAKVELSFAAKAINFRDVYVKRTFQRTNSELQVGNFFFPFGYMRSGINYKFIENSSADAAFVNGRKLGVAYLSYSPHFNWGLGIFSDGNVDNGKKANQGYSFNAYALFRPIDNAGNVFHAGVSGILTHPSSEVTFTAIAPQTFCANTLLKTSAMDVYNYARLEVHALTIVRRFYAEAHFLKAFVNLPNSKTVTSDDGESVTIPQDNYNGMYGVYAQAAWRIFGPNHSYNRKTGLTGNASAKALEVLARFSRIDLDEYGSVNDITLGVNYFINKYLRAKVNYVHSHIVDGAHMDLLQGRLQFSF